MAPTVADWQAKLPEFAAADRTALEPWLTEAVLNTNECAFAERYDDAVIYLAAHLAVTFGGFSCVAGEGGAPGPVQFQMEDRVSENFAIGDWAKTSALGATRYGRRRLNLNRITFMPRCN